MKNDAIDAGFLDIATNTLAIVIIVTMFALLTATPHTSAQSDSRFEESPPLILRMQPALTERPFLDYYLVFDGRIIRWDQGIYIDELIVNGLQKTVNLWSGTLRVSAALEPRDPDSFSATFVPDLRSLAEVATPLTPDAVDAVAASIVGRLKSEAMAPNFVVFPSGMDAFEPLYRSLREQQVWLRWFLWPEDVPLKVERRAVHFTSFEFDF